MILAAGGIGSRMGSVIPKQYLNLCGKPIALHSFELFCHLDAIDELVVVCEKKFRSLFITDKKKVLFADPGERRQDSIYNGLQNASPNASWICTHDAARPLVQEKEIVALLKQGKKTGAAALAIPLISTIKRCNKDLIVEQTVDRSSCWEIQTPQILRRDLMEKGFAFAYNHQLNVTDDVSLAELIQAPVAIVPSSPSNFKITLPFDLTVASLLCNATN
jgi:2-C-methyl-D-erythritol 4-phosphate cytidylyltransferase